LGLAGYIVIAPNFGTGAGITCAVLLAMLAGFCWFGLELVLGVFHGVKHMENSVTPLATKVEQMLTEARVVIPGAQALFGFQFVAMLTSAFDRLPPSAKIVHAVALCLVALNVTLLMTPAALHRLSFGGEDSTRFLRLGSAFLVAAPLLLAAGVSAEMYVVFLKVLESPVRAVAAAAGNFLVLIGFWYVLPLIQRSLNETNQDALVQLQSEK
jgi:hypothetical protein